MKKYTLLGKPSRYIILSFGTKFYLLVVLPLGQCHLRLSKRDPCPKPLLFRGLCSGLHPATSFPHGNRHPLTQRDVATWNLSPLLEHLPATLDPRIPSQTGLSRLPGPLAQVHHPGADLCTHIYSPCARPQAEQSPRRGCWLGHELGHGSWESTSMCAGLGYKGVLLTD